MFLVDYGFLPLVITLRIFISSCTPKVSETYDKSLK